MEEMAKEIKVRQNAQICLAEMDEDRNMKDRIGAQIA
jgi:hypothetical protein